MLQDTMKRKEANDKPRVVMQMRRDGSQLWQSVWKQRGGVNCNKNQNLGSSSRWEARKEGDQDGIQLIDGTTDRDRRLAKLHAHGRIVDEPREIQSKILEMSRVQMRNQQSQLNFKVTVSVRFIYLLVTHSNNHLMSTSYVPRTYSRAGLQEKYLLMSSQPRDYRCIYQSERKNYHCYECILPTSIVQNT